MAPASDLLIRDSTARMEWAVWDMAWAAWVTAVMAGKNR